MARITVEDCLENLDNRFELVLVASKRARQLAEGMEPMVPVENDKHTVLALREIAEGLVSRDILDEKPAEEEENSLEDLFDTDSSTTETIAEASEANSSETTGVTADNADTVAEEIPAS